MTTVRFILFICLQAILFSCSGQHITSDAGHAVSAIEKGALYIYQDKHNNYWFGSDGEGVYRHDGRQLVQFRKKDGLCGDQVRGILEDSAGNIYVNTTGGVSKFDGKVFTPLQVTTDDRPGGKWRLKDGDLWFQGAQDSGVVYRYDGRILHRLEFPKTRAGENHIAKFPRAQYPQMNYSPYDVYSIYRDRKGNLWFGTNIGVCRYNGKTFDWMSEKEIGIDAIAIHVRSTIEDKNGDFWFGNTMHRFDIADTGNAGVVKYKEKRGVVDAIDHDAAYFMSGLEDNNGNLWTVTYNRGVWRYDGKSMERYWIKEGTRDVTLFSIYKDRHGALWVGTHTAGAYKFNGKTFEQFKS